MLRVFGSPRRYVQGPGALREIADLVGAGMVPPVLRWHLLDREAKPPGSVIERGGDEIDWQPTFWR